VRIGWYPVPQSPPPVTDADWLRARWIGSEDLVSLLRRCIEAAYEGFDVVYGVSA
jgi:hypothetical protein